MLELRLRKVQEMVGMYEMQEILSMEGARNARNCGNSGNARIGARCKKCIVPHLHNCSNSTLDYQIIFSVLKFMHFLNYRTKLTVSCSNFFPHPDFNM